MIYLGDWQLLCCKDKRPSVLFIYHGISDPDKLTVANSTLCLTEILLHGLKKNKNIYMTETTRGPQNLKYLLAGSLQKVCRVLDYWVTRSFPSFCSLSLSSIPSPCRPRVGHGTPSVLGKY